MRILGVDVGRRRVGFAISDCTATLARPLRTVAVTARTCVERIRAEIETLASDDDGLDLVVVGLPKRLDGSVSEETIMVESLTTQLRRQVTVPIVTEDERLSSREAERRLAARERDWRKRKAQLDAASAAVILQDYLDRTRGPFHVERL
jgi:putative Holliday junction resolvase